MPDLALLLAFVHVGSPSKKTPACQRPRQFCIVVIERGDTIWCSPDEWHWHGAAPDHFMTHLALWDGLHPDQDGPETEWGDHVTDDECNAGA
jgi:hypothetical protein